MQRSREVIGDGPHHPATDHRGAVVGQRGVRRLGWVALKKYAGGLLVLGDGLIRGGRARREVPQEPQKWVPAPVESAAARRRRNKVKGGHLTSAIHGNRSLANGARQEASHSRRMPADRRESRVRASRKARKREGYARTIRYVGVRKG